MQETSNFPGAEEASQTPCMTSCDDGFHPLPGNCDGKDLDAGHRLEAVVSFSLLSYLQ